MAIFRGSGGSLDGQTESLSFPVSISQGGTGQTDPNKAFNALAPTQQFNSGKYLKTDGANTSWDQIVVSTDDITGVLAVGNGGTGASDAPAALLNLLPSYSGNVNKVLTVNASETDVEWQAITGTGTVTSIALTAPTGFDVSGSPITASGTLALNFASGYALPTTAKQAEWDTAYSDRLKWDGGATGLNASTARTSLGLVIGTDVPSPTGSGASGTWGISITGTAANVTGTVAVANGGTGATTLTGYVKGNGTSAMTASATISGSDIDGGTINGGTY